MIIILVTLFAFVIPVAFVLWKEWKKGKERQAKEGGPAKKKEAVPIKAVLKASAVLVLLAAPVYFISDASYSYYGKDDAMLKVAFKHSGKRVADCAENDLIKKQGDKYRQELKDTRMVKMSIEQLAKCPRERHPVLVELFVDGQKTLDKAYPPTGLKKDMASYIYGEFMVKPGEHKIKVLLYNDGKKDSPETSFETVAQVKPQDIKVIWYNEKAGKLELE